MTQRDRRAAEELGTAGPGGHHVDVYVRACVRLCRLVLLCMRCGKDVYVCAGCVWERLRGGVNVRESVRAFNDTRV